MVFSISLPTEVKFCFWRSWWRTRASLTRLLLCLPWLSFSRRGCHRFLLASPMGSQGLVSKTEGLNFALPFVKKMIWKKAKRRRGFLMAEDQRLVRSRVTLLPDISRPVLILYGPIHRFPTPGKVGSGL